MLETYSPTARKGGIIVASVDELIDKLKNEAKILWSLLDFIILILNGKERREGSGNAQQVVGNEEENESRRHERDGKTQVCIGC